MKLEPIKDFAVDLKDQYVAEAEEAVVARRYGPMMALTVIAFWAIMITLIMSQTPACSSKDDAPLRDDQWH